MEVDDTKGAAIGGLYSLTLQGNQVRASLRVPAARQRTSTPPHHGTPH